MMLTISFVLQLSKRLQEQLVGNTVTINYLSLSNIIFHLIFII